MAAILWKTPQEIKRQLAQRFKERRLFNNFTQTALASRSGVSLGTLKRFERTGEVAVAKMLSLALVLDCLEEFDRLLEKIPLTPADILDDRPRRKNGRQRGRIS